MAPRAVGHRARERVFDMEGGIGVFVVIEWLGPRDQEIFLGAEAGGRGNPWTQDKEKSDHETQAEASALSKPMTANPGGGHSDTSHQYFNNNNDMHPL